MFASLLDHDFLGAIGPEKGKFRSYLLVACQHYLSNEFDRSRAQKRGGDRVTISIDMPGAEGRYASEPSHSLTAERLYERRPFNRDMQSGPARAIRTGESSLVPRVSDGVIAQTAKEYPEYATILRRIGLGSIIVVPLRARTATIGALTIGRSPGRFGVTRASQR